VIQCREAADLIPLHVGDDLETDEARRLEEHLDVCALCVAEYDSYAAARGTLLDLREEQPAVGSLWANVARGLDSDSGAVPAVVAAPLPRRLHRWYAWSGLAAAALLITAFMPQMLSDEPAAPPQAQGDGRQIQKTSAEELEDFLLRTGGSPSPVVEENLEEAPLATPAASKPKRF
jgi:hypothetical protein